MTNELKLCFMAAFLVSCLFNFPVLVLSEPRAPCYFIFGDSLVDNGNNNGLDTNAKVNYPPYGIDFPEGPTGRFSNGRTLADFISEYLGFDDYIQPFATVEDKDIMRGANYASAGAGIRAETGRQLRHVISLDNQLTNHKLAISRIAALHGNKSFTNEYLTKCIYTVGMGNNDYIQNYFAPQFHNSSRVFTPDQFATSLIDLYSQQLQTLYKLGARKIAVFGLGSSGCTPAQVVTFGTKGHRCVKEINDAIDLFNEKIKPLVDDLNSKLTDAKYIAIDGISFIPSIPGIIISDSPCCKVAIEGGTRGLCIPNLTPCRSRLRHIFFDGFHPSESSNFLAAKLAFISLSKLL